MSDVASHTDPRLWPDVLDDVAAHSGPTTLVLVQASVEWLTPWKLELRRSIERSVTRLLFSACDVRVARIMLYDAPGERVGIFAPGWDPSTSDSDRHRVITESLGEWQDIAGQWSAIFTSRRYLKLNRPEDEKLQGKLWVLPQVPTDDLARREADAIPRDELIVAAGHVPVSELYPGDSAQGRAGWNDPRLLWMNAPRAALDPTVGRRPAEVLSSDPGHFFSLELTQRPWWGD